MSYRRLCVALVTSLLCSALSPAACAPVVNSTRDSDVVITQEQAGTTVGVTVGQTVLVQWPNSDRWNIAFGSPPLELVKSSDESSTGWRFRVVSAGQTDIVITLITTGDAAPAEFTVTIRATG